jgi:hypothetical protein
MMTDNARNIAHRFIEPTRVAEVFHPLNWTWVWFSLDYKHRTNDLGSFVGRMDSELVITFCYVLRNAEEYEMMDIGHGH